MKIKESFGSHSAPDLVPWYQDKISHMAQCLTEKIKNQQEIEQKEDQRAFIQTFFEYPEMEVIAQ